MESKYVLIMPKSKLAHAGTCSTCRPISCGKANLIQTSVCVAKISRWNLIRKIIQPARILSLFVSKQMTKLIY